MFDPKEWGRLDVNDVSNDSLTIVGTGFNPATGAEQGWVAVLPEPGVPAMLAYLAASQLLRRRRSLLNVR